VPEYEALDVKHVARWLVCFPLFAAACVAPPPPSHPTPTPTLNVNLWADYPLVVVGHPQGASVVVTDSQGAAVVGATVIGTYKTPQGTESITFITTDADGRAHADLRLPFVTSPEMLSLSVTVVQGSDWGQAATTFELRP